MHGGDTVAGFASSDVLDYFGPVRGFAFGEIARGNFPLWDPHIFAGKPCFGAFQAGLLYPLNAIYLVLPLAMAVNADLWLHVTLFGLAMYAWARNALSPLPAFYAAIVAMFGPYFLHVMCGHLPMLACLAWTPLLFLAYDRLRAGGGLGWVLVGTGSAAMQALAGWPQGIFMTTVVFGLYWALTVPSATHRLRVTGLVIIIAVSAALMGAAQLWTGIETSAESVRGSGLPYGFVMSFSLPRENLLTFLAPGVFGDDHHVPYFAWNHFWEACAFVGIATLVLAAFGTLTAPWSRKYVLLAMAFVLLVLTLGAYTPLFRILYTWAPGFDRLRAMGRFAIFFSMFAALLAGEGIRMLLTGRRDHLGPIAGGLLLLAAALAFAGLVTAAPLMSGAPVPAWIGAMRQSFIDTWPSRFPEMRAQVAYSAYALEIAAMTCVVLSVLCLIAKKRAWAISVLIAFGVMEIGVFARTHRGMAHLNDTAAATVAQIYARDPGDYRVLMRADYDAPITAGGYGVWGYDALIPDRYAQFFGHSLGLEERVVDTVVPRLRYRPMHRIVRCKYVVPNPKSNKPPHEVPDPMPHYFVVHEYHVATGQESVFAAMDQETFDPERTVILEQEPEPKPQSAPGEDSIRIIAGDTDHTVLEAVLASPGILVVTDSYAKSWRVRPAGVDPPQERYDLLPANYALRAVPLAAGDHRIVMEYAPPGYVYGRWITLAAWIGFGLACTSWLLRYKAF